jgi:hypothetical protein
MSSHGQKWFLEDILEQVKRHRDLYRYAELQSVIALRRDSPSKNGRWYNILTLIKMLHSSKLKPPKKQIEKNSFAIISTTITMNQLRKFLKRLTDENLFEIGGYQVHGPFTFHQREFIISERSRRVFDIDWAANVWRATGTENFGLPDSRSLELESEDIPFDDAVDAIRYYTGVSLRDDSSLQNAIHVIAPLYYARISNVRLSEKALSIKIQFGLADAKSLKVKFNTEGRDERSNYNKVIEARTVKPINGTTTIRLKHDAETTTVWLYHARGYKVDSCSERRIPSIEDIEEQISRDSPYLGEEQALVITKQIDRYSRKTAFPTASTEYGVDSVDVDILGAMKDLGGDYAKFIPEVVKYLSLSILLRRLARLRKLGYVTLEHPGKILLTSRGVDALNLPPSVLPAKIPHEIGERMAEIELAFRNEEYDKVINASTKLLEALLRDRLETRLKERLSGNWSKLKLMDYERASLGVLKDACIRLKVLKKNSVSDHLISTILQLRIPVSHEKREMKSPADIASLTVRLMEAFLRDWYYLE